MSSDIDPGRTVITQVALHVIVRGLEMALTPHELDELELYDLEEVERPPGYTDMKNMIGKFPVLTRRGYHHVWVASALEADHYLELVWAGVEELNTQCLEIRAELSDGSVRVRRPDALTRLDGTTAVIDITSENGLDEGKAASFDLTADVCASIGWGYLVGSDKTLSRTRRANLNYLTSVEDIDIEPPGIDPGRTVRDLAAAYGGGSQGRMLAHAALWRQHYWINMERPLEDTSKLVRRAPAAVLFPWEPV
ncbi:MAG: hypothetical protein HGA44_00160 [Cellulomonadaceae bacterium]|nr:hypothetical protein [Cellulomonadaceae bacterium]